MRNRLVRLAAVAALAGSLLAANAAAVAAGPPPPGGASLMPPNYDKIAGVLMARGEIRPDMPPAEQEAIVTAYLQKKLAGGSADKAANPAARQQLMANEEVLNNAASSDLRGKKLGNKPAEVAPSSPQFKPTAGSDKLLLILVEFSNQDYTWTTNAGTTRTAAGPLHNNIPIPNNSFDLYVPDFSTQHYEDMLFTPGGWTMPSNAPRYAGAHRGSMHDYYLEQSYGKYTVDGQAYGWFTVNKPEAYYGDDDPAGGEDNLRPGTTRDLIADTVAVANAQNAIDWAEYDTNGDCVIDHPLFIHAGIDQSGGGGAQGDDAIWAHSSSVDQPVSGPTDACPNGISIQNYTIMPEDGGVGVFSHEFGHDLGLPDEYDTIYSGRGDSVAFWSLMSSGSWLGQPAQTQPSDISIWGKYALGWLTAGENLAVVSASDLQKGSTTELRLEQAERWGGTGTLNAVRINLPPKTYYVNTPHGGTYEWFGGRADQSDTTIRRTVDLTGKTSASLAFWTWYDIEQDWDFGFVQVSTDGGSTWASLPIDGTTDSIVADGMPSIAANMPGFTGTSNGWIQKTFDLKDYVGQSIELQFRYMTDYATTMAGFYVDDISVTADGSALFTDDVETLDPAWTVAGWTREPGFGTKTHYYMLEWRNTKPLETPLGGTTVVNFDNGLSTTYSFDAVGDEPMWFSYNPGLLMWYRDMTFTDNWTGVHPGGGFLLVVDAHSQAMLRPPLPKSGSLPWNSRVQSYDSPFSLDKALDATLTYWGTTRTYTGLPAVPTFDDSHSYWSPKAPAASVITPTYGLIFRVLGEAVDGSAALIGLGLK